MHLVEYPNVIKIMRRDIIDLSDDLVRVAQQLEKRNKEIVEFDLKNEGLVESMRRLSKMILDYDNNVLKKYERIITEYENL